MCRKIFSFLYTFKHNFIFILLKQKFIRLSSPSEYFYFDIRYKRYSPDTMVNNYKDDFFNLQNWKKNISN